MGTMPRRSLGIGEALHKPPPHQHIIYSLLLHQLGWRDLFNLTPETIETLLGDIVKYCG